MAIGYRTLDGIDFNDIWYGGSGILAAVDQYRRVDLPVVTNLAIMWDETLFKYGIGQKNGFQVLGPSQRPDRKLVQVATMYPNVRKYGYGVGTDFDTLRRSTGREIMMDLNRPMAEDPELVVRRFFEVMLTNPGTNNLGRGFYNGQFAPEEKITAPVQFQNNVFNANHTHYYGTGSATLTLQDLTAAKTTIRHHGYNGALVAFINSQERQALENMALWTGNIIRSTVSDEIAIKGFTERFELLGIVFHVTEMVPPGYILLVEANQAEGGRPLVMYEPTNIRGLQMHPGPSNDYPLIESFWDRWFDVAVAGRGVGVAIQITTSTSYTSPVFN